MLKSKRLAAWLLLAFVLASTLAQPAAAIAYIPATPITPGELPVVEETKIELEQVSTGRTVSMVYRYATINTTILGCLENGTKIQVIGTSGQFYRISCYEIKGYIAKAQVSQNENGEYYVNADPTRPDTKVLPTVSASEAMKLRSMIRATAKQYLGVPYVWGGQSPRGFDCSGFTQYVFRKNGYNLHRSALQQLQDGIIISKADLQCGDLIFFTGTVHSGSYASHIGIYIGNGQMIHAGSNGIAIVDFNKAYYQNHFLCARRVILTDVVLDTIAPTTGLTQSINSSFWRENTQTESDGLGSFSASGLA